MEQNKLVQSTKSGKKYSPTFKLGPESVGRVSRRGPWPEEGTTLPKESESTFPSQPVWCGHCPADVGALAKPHRLSVPVSAVTASKVGMCPWLLACTSQPAGAAIEGVLYRVQSPRA